jgi:acyl transferase domain-containing protein/acyl carrier protein
MINLGLNYITMVIKGLERKDLGKIAIVGMGCCFPGGANDPNAYWSLIRNGQDAISEIPPERWEWEDFYSKDASTAGKTNSKWGGFLKDVDIRDIDYSFFRLSPNEASALDPQQRLLLEVSWRTFESACICPSTLKNKKVGVFIGITTNDCLGQQIWSNHRDAIDLYSGLGAMGCSASGRLSYFYGFEGPSISIDTACSSSLVAFHYACQSLRSEECDIALVGGVNCLLSPNPYIYLSKLGVLSPTGRCKAFDASADGYVRSEGCGVVLLKRAPDAVDDQNRIFAISSASAVNHGGFGTSYTSPKQNSQVQLIQDALSKADLQPEQIDYIETHGTGNPLGDAAELHALEEVFSHNNNHDQSLLIGSAKTSIGHLEAGAGMAGLIKTILSLQHESIPPNLHFNNPVDTVAWDKVPFRVPQEAVSWPAHDNIRHAGISSFGITGTNAHVILEDFEPESQPIKTADKTALQKKINNKTCLSILPISAKSKEALVDLAQAYKSRISNSLESLSDLGYAASMGRTHFPIRKVFTGKELNYISGKLDQFICEPKFNKTTKLNGCFIIEGAASLTDNEIRYLYDHYFAFREGIDECEHSIQQYTEFSYSTYLIDNCPVPEQIPLTELNEFVLNYSLGKLYMSWGIVPRMILGSGIGELAGACLTQKLNLDKSISLILQNATPVLKNRVLDDNNINVPVVSMKDTNDKVILQSIIDNQINFLFHVGKAEFKSLEDECKIEVYKHLLCNENIDESFEERTVNSIVLFYEHGNDVIWRNFYGNRQFQAISLPLYPFQRQRCYRDSSSTQNAIAHLSSDQKEKETVIQTFRNAPSKIRKKLLLDFINSTARNVTGQKTFVFDKNTPLHEQGFDSLSTVEFCNCIEKVFHLNLNPTFLFNYPNILKITDFLMPQIEKSLNLTDEKDIANKPNPELARTLNKQKSNQEQGFDYINDLDTENLEQLIKEELDIE